jgi:hypothetical protein
MGMEEHVSVEVMDQHLAISTSPPDNQMRGSFHVAVLDPTARLIPVCPPHPLD